MSFDKLQFKMFVLEVLDEMEPEITKSDSALNLLVGTAAQESHYGTFLKQLEGGPAKGVFQMEPFTHDDIWHNFIAYKQPLKDMLFRVCGLSEAPDPETLVWDLKYATVMARIHYYRRPEPLPAWDDVNGLADYWKEHYNTHLGAGTVEEFVENYDRYVE